MRFKIKLLVIINNDKIRLRKSLKILVIKWRFYKDKQENIGESGIY